VTRTEAEFLADAAQHLQVLKQHLSITGVDDQLVLDAAALRLSAAIESISNVSDTLRSKGIPEHEWRAIRGMRNRIAHAYGFMDPAALRKTLRADVAKFEADIHKLIELADD
jgi:uncharacterized protein with HEPN domain